MKLFVLEAFLRIFAVRGHIPGYDGLPERPAKPSPNENSTPLMPTVAIVGVVLAAVLLMVWVAVSIGIKSL